MKLILAKGGLFIPAGGAAAGLLIRRRASAAGDSAHRKGADLSLQARARDGRICSRWAAGHCRAACCSVAVGARPKARGRPFSSYIATCAGSVLNNELRAKTSAPL